MLVFCHIWARLFKVNVSLKFQILISEICQCVCLNNVRNFYNAKASLIFLSKNMSAFGYKVVKHN